MFYYYIGNKIKRGTSIRKSLKSVITKTIKDDERIIEASFCSYYKKLQVKFY